MFPMVTMVPDRYSVAQHGYVSFNPDFDYDQNYNAALALKTTPE